MSKLSTALKTPSTRSVVPHKDLSEDVVRDYAYHLYQQGSRVPGHDVADWLEATACLKANIPAQASRSRLHHHVNGQSVDKLHVAAL